MSIGIGIGLGVRTRLAPAVAPFVRDTFTFGPSGTDLATHTPEIGGTIVHRVGANPVVSTGANRVRGHTSTQTQLVAYTGTAVANVVIEADVYVSSDNNSAAMGVAARINAVADTCYVWRLNTSGDILQMYSIAAGVATLIGSAAQVITALSTYHLTFSAIGDQLIGSINGVAKVTVTNTDIAAAGHVGIRTGGIFTDSTGLHLDNLTAVAA